MSLLLSGICPAETQYRHLFKPRRQKSAHDPTSPFFPWPDREVHIFNIHSFDESHLSKTCVLDILRHIPRCSFSRKQNLAIHWAMLALGVPNLPSDRTMDDIDKELQKLCGIKSIHYEGAFNHIYYVNDLSAIISQVWPTIENRCSLTFYLGNAQSKYPPSFAISS